MTALTVTVPAVLLPERADDAVRLLRGYFTPLAEGGQFEGGEWDAFDPSFTRRACAGLFTSDDVLSLAYLGVRPLPAATIHRLLVRDADRMSALLRAIGPDRDFVDVDGPDGHEYEPVHELFHLLAELPGVGEATATKLLARKRPRLVPMLDGIVCREVLHDEDAGWAALHALLVADDRALHRHLLDLHARAGLSGVVSPLRVLDALAWLEGTGKSRLVA